MFNFRPLSIKLNHTLAPVPVGAPRLRASTTMMRFLVPLVLSAFALASPKCNSKVKESIEEPREWIKMGAAPADHMIALRIALPQSNFDALEQHLYEVSDPSHSRYGEHLSKEEVEELVAPHEDSVNAVTEWLEEHGIAGDEVSRSAAGDWVRVRVPVDLAEKMLDTVCDFLHALIR